MYAPRVVKAMYIKSLLLVFLFLSDITLYAQPSYTFQTINTKDGLSNNSVLSIIQDKEGFIWFGTDDGLNRYDGESFRIFKPEPKAQNSISHSITKVLMQDSNGTIWIGTDGGGVNAFNPKTEEFISFSYNPNDSTSLSNDNVSAIIEDHQHQIWIGTYGGGLNRFNPNKNNFTRLINEPNNPNSVCSDYINCLTIDKQNNLWIGTWGRGIDKYDIAKNHFTNYQYNPSDPNSLSNSTVNTLFIDKDDALWIGTWGSGLDLLNSQSQTFSHLANTSNPNSLSNNIVRSITQDKNGTLWIGTFGGGINLLNPKTKEITRIENTITNNKQLPNNNIWTLLYTPNNIIWAGSIEGGVSKIEVGQPLFKHINFTSNDGSSDNTVIVSALCETSDKRVIAGSWDHGIATYNSLLNPISNNIPQLPNTNINAIVEDRFERLWIATTTGLYLFDPKTNKIKNYHYQPNNFKALQFNNISSLYQDHLGTIWVGTLGMGLYRYEPATDNFTLYLASKKSNITFCVDMSGIPVSPKGVHLAGNMNGWNPSDLKLTQVKENIYQITVPIYPGRTEYKFLNGDTWGNEEQVPENCAENKNRILYVGEKELVLDAVLFAKGCNKIQTKPIEAKIDPKDFVLSSNHILSINEDQQGTLWIGTDKGLNRYNSTTDSFEKFYHSASDTTSLSDNHVSYIFTDSDGDLWIGTLGGGLNIFNKKNNQFTSFTEADGLANNMVKGVTEDIRGNIWISTNRGLSCFKKKSNHFVNYTAQNGLTDEIFRRGACLKMDNNQLAFGTSSGITTFNPDSLFRSQSNGKVMVTGISLFNKPVKVGEETDGRVLLTQSVQSTKELTFFHNENVITFHFANMHFNTASKTAVAYKLEGFDTKWQLANNDNQQITYTNLNGGNYTLKLATVEPSGKIGNPAAELKITIKPPFYNSLLFKLLLLVILSLLIYFWYKTNVLNRRKKLEREQIKANQRIIELEKEKLEAQVQNKDSELGDITMQMIYKTGILNEQIEKLSMIANQADTPIKEKLNKLITRLKDETAFEKEWEFFELHFDKVYQNFITNIKAKYPTLPSVDIRLAAFIRMGLNTNQIAQLMNLTIRGVESRRYRLRQALKLESGDNLSDFLFNMD